MHPLKMPGYKKIIALILNGNVDFTIFCPFFKSDGRNKRFNLTTSMGIAIKVVIRSYFRQEVYKLYQFGLPSIPKAKNLVLIIRNLIFLEINIYIA